MNFAPQDTPLSKLEKRIAKADYTIERLVAMDQDKAAAHYGIPLSWVQFAREEAIKRKGGDPNVLCRPEARSA